MNNYCEIYEQELQKRKKLQKNLSNQINVINNNQLITNNYDNKLVENPEIENKPVFNSDKKLDNQDENNFFDKNINQELNEKQEFNTNLNLNKKQDNVELNNNLNTYQGSDNMQNQNIKNDNVNVDNSAQIVDSSSQLHNNQTFNDTKILKDDNYVEPIPQTPTPNNPQNNQPINNVINNLLFGLSGTSCDYRTVKVLKNLMSSIISEMTAVNTYVYQHQIANLTNTELGQALNLIAKDEMKHLEMLSYAIVQFGGRPKYTNANNVFWNARYVDYSINIPDFLQNDIKAERQAILNYEKAIAKVSNQSLKNMFRNNKIFVNFIKTYKKG